MTITAQEAAQRIDRLNGDRTIQHVPASMLATAKLVQFYIYNVGPDQFIRSTGVGTFIIPACKPGQKVSEPLVIDSTIFTPVRRENGYSQEANAGIDVVHDILQDRHPMNYLRYGVFVAENGEATDEEISKARQARNAYNMTLVQDADDFYAVNQGAYSVNVGGQNLTRNYINDAHRKALKELGWERPWEKKDVAMARCWNCNSQVLPKAVKCPNPACQVPLTEKGKKKYLAALEDEE